MKNLSLFVSAAAILSASSAFAAIDCATLPTCEALGYTDTVSQCSNKSIKCPFDTSKGTCLHEAAIGEIAYFPGRAPLGRGWLPCDGSTYSRTEYPELAAFLDGAPLNDASTEYGNPFCKSAVQKYHGSCSNSTFAVPDYRGYFLRVAGMWRSGNSTSWNANFLGKQQAGRVNSINNPEAEELPNITGTTSYYLKLARDENWNLRGAHTGAFSGISNVNGIKDATTTKNGWWDETATISFDASKTEGTGKNIYKNSGHVIPANYSVYAYIYAGKVVK